MFPQIKDEMFPELKESEDERIRKALKEYFINSFQNNGVAAILGVHIKDILAWLEKQGEQNPAWSEEDDTFFKAIIRDIENIQYISEDAKKDRINWLKFLKDRYTWKPSDEQLEALWNVYQGGEEQAELATLYNDLKKLRG